jgi:putative hemolysin
LFVWNRVLRHIVGAYRVARTDRIVETLGVAGLYTSTLFRYDDRLVGRLTPGFELGRSFVRPEYQRSYNALLLLWRGIGKIVARSPECRFLFGPVSISARYQDSTQQMLRAYLAQNHCDEELTELVRPLNPPAALAPPQRSVPAPADVDELDALIKRLEQHEGMPVLLRQYLRLNATLLGFNVDPAFGDALDALMAVDLTRLSLPTLQRYLGRAEARTFLARHKSDSTVLPLVAA